MMLGGRSVGVGMGELLCKLKPPAYFDWLLVAMKPMLGRQVFGHIAFRQIPQAKPWVTNGLSVIKLVT